jgi:integrase/recombinase XerD
MLKVLYPGFRRYTSLAVLGPVVDGFSTWLVNQQYTPGYIRRQIWLLPHIEAVLIRRGVTSLSEIRDSDWKACRKRLLKRFPYLTDSTGALEKYLHAQNLLTSEPDITSTTHAWLAEYARYLEKVRGAASCTIRQNSYTASEFLQHLDIENHPERAESLKSKDLEVFLKKVSRRFTRRSLRQITVRLRCFVRFLAQSGKIPHKLDGFIDTPRVYRDEELPGTLPWKTVQKLIRSIDQSSSQGLRDFTMFLLMACYGLRASDVVALTLDDVQWRARKISISQSKTGTLLELPLTDTVGAALCRYLRKSARPATFRHIFLRGKAPIGPLKTTALSTAFRKWADRAGVTISGRGSCHRIRHSYAVSLLRREIPLKTIGDILGHRAPQSTGTYLRLALEDLRDVGLPVPAEFPLHKAVRA